MLLRLVGNISWWTTHRGRSVCSDDFNNMVLPKTFELSLAKPEITRNLKYVHLYLFFVIVFSDSAEKKAEVRTGHRGLLSILAILC